MDHTLVESPHSDPVSDSEFQELQKSLVSIRLGTFVRPSLVKHSLKIERMSLAQSIRMILVYTHVHLAISVLVLKYTTFLYCTLSAWFT